MPVGKQNLDDQPMGACRTSRKLIAAAVALKEQKPRFLIEVTVRQLIPESCGSGTQISNYV
jgi:hypothetical protein